MTEKRFKLDSEVGFIDTQKCGEDTMTFFEVVVKLNKLNEENEKLQQFKNKVFELLHKKLKEYPYLTLTEKWNNDCKYKHSCRENHEKNVVYATTHTLLNELIKELRRND